MSGLDYFLDGYRHFMETKSDPRTSDWILVGSPGPLITILVTYLYFCISAGPRYMKDRKPYDLRNAILVYNAVQVVMSVFLVYEGVQGGWFNGYSFTCQPVDYSSNPQSMRMARAVWWYYFCKLTELLDTVFFVLRKKSNQVSFLHLYHHSMMPVCAWIGARFLPGGHGTLLGFINSFIHIVMYTYYLLASLGPQYQKYLWWKKYLTRLQLGQFCIIFLHNFQMIFHQQCNYPTVIICLLGTQSLFFLYLFGAFYIKTYTKKKQIENGITDNNNTKNGKLKAM